MLSERWTRNLFSAARVGVGVALVVYVLSARGGWSAMRPLIHTLWLLPALATFTFLGTALESKRLGILLRSQGALLPFLRGCRLVAVGAFFNVCIPGGTGGDVVKLYYLAQANRRQVVEMATVLFVDRAVGLFSLLSLVVGFGLLNAAVVRAHASIQLLVVGAAIGAAALLVIAVIACSVRIRASRWYRLALNRLPFRHYMQRASDALGAFRHHKSALLAALMLSVSGHLVLAGMFLVIGPLLIPGVTGLLTCLLGFLGVLANALPITPGGLGVGEIAFDRLFGAVGFAGGAALILTWRAGMVPLWITGGLLYIVGVQGGTHGASVSEASKLAAPVE